MLDMRQFWNYCQPYVTERAVLWGFRPHSRGIFVRESHRVWHGFAVVPSRNQPHSCYVEVGLHVPALLDRLKFIDQTEDLVGFEVSHRLGTYREGAEIGVHQWYGFRTERQLTEALDRMLGHFQAWALPWYERFPSVVEATQAFYEFRIEGAPRGNDPFGWALYGWMLEDSGKKNEAMPWLERAYAEVTRPLFIDPAGRFVKEGTKRAKPYRHTEAEERLEELLRQSLKLSLPRG